MTIDIRLLRERLITKRTKQPNATNMPNNNQLPMAARPAVMGAIATLTRHGHHRDAQYLWARYISPNKVNVLDPLLPGETR